MPETIREMRVSLSDWGTWAGLAAIILVSNAGMWTIFHDRIQKLEGKVDDLRMRMNQLDTSTRVLLERRVSAVEQELAATRSSLQQLKVDDSSRSKQLKRLAQNGNQIYAVSWSLLVAAVSDCFSAIQSRLEWHLSWLERLSDNVGLVHRDGLKAGDVKHRLRLTPRMYEVELCSESGPRRAAAQSLADAAGDHVTLVRLQGMAGVYPELLPPCERLVARLAESSEGPN